MTVTHNDNIDTVDKRDIGVTWCLSADQLVILLHVLLHVCGVTRSPHHHVPRMRIDLHTCQKHCVQLKQCVCTDVHVSTYPLNPGVQPW